MIRRLLAVAAIFVCVTSPLSAQSLDDLVEKAKFIFAGDVVKLNASTLPTVPATPKTAVVRVTDVLTGDELLTALVGQEITVEMLQPAVVEKTVFFTNVVVYGNSVEVVELAHQPVGDGGAAAMRARIAEALRRNKERGLLARIQNAERVVAGKVDSVRRTGNAQRRSEHDPMWATAVIKVSSVLKGLREEQVEVLFPTSNDEMWVDAPRFAQGQSGVWILRRERHERGVPRPIGVLTALQPGDFQPLSELARLRDLIAGKQR